MHSGHRYCVYRPELSKDAQKCQRCPKLSIVVQSGLSKIIGAKCASRRRCSPCASGGRRVAAPRSTGPCAHLPRSCTARNRAPSMLQPSFTFTSFHVIQTFRILHISHTSILSSILFARGTVLLPVEKLQLHREKGQIGK